MSTMEIPILRMGAPYRSLDTVELELEGGGVAVTHIANPGLIRRDLRRIAESRAALEAIPAETLADRCEAAAELFLAAELPLGETGTQGPGDYVEALSAVTKLPHALVRMNMGKIHAAMSRVRTVIGGLTRGLPPALFDGGLSRVGGLQVNYYPVTRALGVSLPSNAPAVNSLWIPAPVMKIPVLLKPGREDPFTPYRIVQAMIAAGFPAGAFGYYRSRPKVTASLIGRNGRWWRVIDAAGPPFRN